MEGSEAGAERMNGRSAHERGRFGELSSFARRFKWTKSADPDRCLQWRFYHKARQTLCGELLDLTCTQGVGPHKRAASAVGYPLAESIADATAKMFFDRP